MTPTYIHPGYKTCKHVEDEGIELIAEDGLTAATIVGSTPEAQALIEAAPELYEALVYMVREFNLRGLNIRKDFSKISAHASATRALHKAGIWRGLNT